MLFNSLEFALFLPIVFFAYWFGFHKSLRIQNVFLIVSSYFFYGWWDWRFLILIIFSSALDFTVGRMIYASDREEQKKKLLLLSLFSNLGLLAVFKYFNFFVESFVSSFSFLGFQIDSWTINIILPVGISFYSFQTLSYTIDIYRGQLKPTSDPVAFFAFVSFFPQLVAGPIERAANLLPQFDVSRRFDYTLAIHGLRQILWGLFKKVVIADNCAPFVDTIFASPSEHSSTTLLIGAVLFCIQVYADFSGYSDIAIGVAKLFGFKLMTNFKTPYFSTSWGEFWKRWHISLSSWILDYVYNPLAINRRHWGTAGIVFALVITFTLNGLWHGANWTYVVFGLLMGAFISSEFLFRKRARKIEKLIGKNLHNFAGWLITMSGWVLACILFRSSSIDSAILYYTNLIFSDVEFHLVSIVEYGNIVFLIAFLFMFELKHRDDYYEFELGSIKSRPVRWSIYSLIIASFFYFPTNAQQFIYFQF